MTLQNTLASPSLSRRVHWLITLIAGLAIAGIAFVLVEAVITTDGATRERQRTLVEHGIELQIEKVSHDQESVTYWDDAVLAAARGDQQWLHENLGEWMFTYFGHDRTLISAPSGEIVYAMSDGVSADPAIAADTLRQVSPQVASVRREFAQADPDELVVKRSIFSVDDRPAVVSTMPILPHSDRMTVAQGEEFTFTSIQFLDKAFLSKLREEYLLSDAHVNRSLHAEKGAASVPIIGSNGRPISFLSWTPDLPGRQILLSVLPIASLGTVFVLVLVAYFARRFYRASSALEASEARATHLAYHDSLTGLPNRAHLMERIDRALARQSEETMALLFLDLDRFKQVNDTFGHQAGDEVIWEFASRAARHLRRQDTFGRLGGDEFAILLREVESRDEIEAFCDRIIDTARASFSVSGGRATVGVSIGYALADEAVERGELLRRADIALYAAKNDGRSCYRRYSEELDASMRERRDLEQDLRRAIEAQTGELAVHYQPLVSSRTGDIHGVEALVRWVHPRLGTISPAVFVPIAEEFGLVSQLDQWVLRTACRDAGAWGDLALAVNISPRSFSQPALAERLLRVLDEEGFDPDRLEVEVTESVLLEEQIGAADELQVLRSRGIRVALDDFGTGYSSLSHLHTLKVDKVKVDRSFVKHLGEAVDSTAIVNAVVQLARALGLVVTAEGVETEAQRDYLRSVGCDQVQGFLFSKAVPAADFEQMLKERMAA